MNDKTHHPGDPHQEPPWEEQTLPLFPTVEETQPLPEEVEVSSGEPVATEPAPPRRRDTLTPDEQEQIKKLHAVGLGTRQIARQLGRSRHVVRKTLREAGLLDGSCRRKQTPASRASKLDPFRELIKEKTAKGLTVTRVLRELREQGYTGGRSILSDFMRTIRAPLAPRRSRKVTRRFETPPGLECQVDWSTYRIRIGGKERIMHALGIVLGYSRKGWLRFYESQRQARLQEGEARAFEAFEGVTRRVVYDNMSTVVLGRVGSDRRPIWNPDHVAFARHYGFEPYLCRVAQPDRKGEIEAFLGYAERDLVRGLEPDSVLDLNRCAERWLDEVANKRVHGTTGRVPDEVWEHEKDFLIALPETRYAGACDLEYRQVASDSTVSVRGVRYTVPVHLAHRQVRVRLYAERFCVLDRDGSVAFESAYADPREAGRLVLDPTHYGEFKRGPGKRGGTTRRLEERFLLRWPNLEEFLTQLKLHMKGLVHVDLRKLLRLAERFGDEALLDAAQRAHAAGRHTANAVRRILEQKNPHAEEPEPVLPLGAEARAQALLDDVEEGSLDSFAHLDTLKPTSDSDGEQEGEVPCAS